MTVLREIARQMLLRSSRAIGQAGVVLVVELVRTSHYHLSLVSISIDSKVPLMSPCMSDIPVGTSQVLLCQERDHQLVAAVTPDQREDSLLID